MMSDKTTKLIDSNSCQAVDLTLKGSDKMSEIKQNRDFMKCPCFDDDKSKSDQQRGVPHPAHGKDMAGELIELPSFENAVTQKQYMDLLDIRRSERVYSETPMTQEQMAFMLWTAQGAQEFRGINNIATLRPVPSGGARHPFELYVAVQNVDGLKAGLYRYAPMQHVGEKLVAIEFLSSFDDYKNQITALLAGQSWAAKAPIVLFFSCIPYRAEWRYSEAAHRVMLIDLGHAGQNVMLSAAALGLGSCCMAAYDQKLCDTTLGFDGTDEYTVYAIAVGTPEHITRKGLSNT